MRESRALRAVVLALLGPEHRHYAWDLAREARVGSGRLYPVLDRLERNGWVGSDWDEPGRPSRRHYYLTFKGTQEALRIQRDCPPRPPRFFGGPRNARHERQIVLTVIMFIIGTVIAGGAILVLALLGWKRPSLPMLAVLVVLFTVAGPVGDLAGGSLQRTKPTEGENASATGELRDS